MDIDRKAKKFKIRYKRNIHHGQQFLFFMKVITPTVVSVPRTFIEFEEIFEGILKIENHMA